MEFLNYLNQNILKNYLYSSTPTYIQKLYAIHTYMYGANGDIYIYNVYM